jgi:hydroxypyruvate isomerase
MEGELANTIRTRFAHIAHPRLGHNPARNGPGSGEINCPFPFDFIDRQGFDGWIGCEDKPAAATRDGWLVETLCAPGSMVAQHKWRNRT